MRLSSIRALPAKSLVVPKLAVVEAGSPLLMAAEADASCVHVVLAKGVTVVEMLPAPMVLPACPSTPVSYKLYDRLTVAPDAFRKGTVPLLLNTIQLTNVAFALVLVALFRWMLAMTDPCPAGAELP